MSSITLGTDYIATKAERRSDDRRARPDRRTPLTPTAARPAIRSRSMTERSDDSSLALANVAAQVADSSKATDIVILDVGDVLSITGFFVIAGASNPRLVRATVDEIERRGEGRISAAHRVRIEGLREQQWILMDYGDVVVHVFLDSIREFYEIERLYLDVPRIALGRRRRHGRTLTKSPLDLAPISL